MKPLTYDDYLIKQDFDNLPITLNELFNFVDLNLTSDLYENNNFTNDELELLEESSFNLTNGLYKQLMLEDDNLFESLTLLNEKVGENTKRKFIRVNTKKLIHKIRMKYRDLVSKLKTVFAKKIKKDPQNKNSFMKTLSDKLSDLKKWLDKMVGKINKKAKKKESQLAIAA